MECRDLIERIVTLGFYYRELERFATKSRNLSWIRSGKVCPLETTSELTKARTEKHSVYRRAIANGIVEILSVYRSAVLHIEQKLLSETVPILATVTQGLNKVVYNTYNRTLHCGMLVCYLDYEYSFFFIFFWEVVFCSFTASL